MVKEIRNKVYAVVNGKVADNAFHIDANGKQLSYVQIRNKMEGLARTIKNAGGQPTQEQLAEMQLLAVAGVQVMEDVRGAVTDTFIQEIPIDKPNAKMTKTGKINEFLDPVAPIQTIKGNGDRVPLMQPRFLNDDITLDLYGVGNVVTIMEELSNPIFNADAVMRSAKKWHTDIKELAFFKPLIAYTYEANNKQAADNTSGATYYEKLDNTMRLAQDKLDKLVYQLDKKKLATMAGRVVVFANRGTKRNLESIGIHLDRQSVRDARGFDIIEWNGFSGYTYGDEVVLPVTIPDGKCYMALIPDSPEGLCKITGADLEYRSGEGTALAGSSKEEAWFSYFGLFMKYFIPGGNGQGCVIEVTLP